MNKSVVEGLFSILLGGLIATAFLGILAKEMEGTEDTFVFSIALHRMLAYSCLAFYLLSVGATEWMIRIHGEKPSPYFIPHLICAISSFVLFLCALYFNGSSKRKHWHRYFTYSCLASYVIAFMLALPLLNLF